MANKAMRSYKEMLWESNQRRDGRADALAGRPPTLDDEHYRRGYREGLAPCQCDNSAAHRDGCQREPASGDLCDFCARGHNE